MYKVTLSDDTTFKAMPDGVGNMICPDTLDKSIFSHTNLSRVTVEENGIESVYTDQTLRTFYHQEDGSTFIRISDKTDMEKISLDIDMILDLSADQEYKLCLIELGLI